MNKSQRVINMMQTISESISIITPGKYYLGMLPVSARSFLIDFENEYTSYNDAKKYAGDMKEVFLAERSQTSIILTRVTSDEDMSRLVDKIIKQSERRKAFPFRYV